MQELEYRNYKEEHKNRNVLMYLSKNGSLVLPRVPGCGHKHDHYHSPRHRGCQNCWFAWFNNHGELVQTLDEALTKDGPSAIINKQSRKFYHRWRQFMSTLANLKKEKEQVERKTEARIK